MGGWKTGLSGKLISPDSLYSPVKNKNTVINEFD